MVSVRLDEKLVAWMYDFAGEGQRTDFIERLLVACRDRRLIITSEPVFYDVHAGSSPTFPALMCRRKESK